MQVNIKYVNFPSINSTGKYGSIVDQSGTKIQVPVDMLNLFRAGMICEIGVKTQTWGKGTDREADVVIATTGPLKNNTGAVQGQGAQAGYQGASQAAAPQRPNTGFLPRVYQGGAGQPAPQLGQTQADQARQIFVTGVVGRSMGSGKFAASEIPVLVKAANEGYDVFQRLERGEVAAPAATPGGGWNMRIGHDEPPPAEPGDPGPQE